MERGKNVHTLSCRFVSQMMIFSSYGHENYKDPCSLLFTIDNISTTCHIILVVKSNINVVLQILHLTITTFLQ